MTNGTGDGQTSPGVISFDPRRQFNRAGLALSRRKSIYLFCLALPIIIRAMDSLSVMNAGQSRFFSMAYNATPNDGPRWHLDERDNTAIDENGDLCVSTGNALKQEPDQFKLQYLQCAGQPIN